MPRLLGRLGQIACALALAATGIAGCGDDDSPQGLASLAPPDTPLYAEALIGPEGDQADAIDSLAERVGGVGDPGATFVAQLDEFLAANGIDATYAGDIDPWLGDRGAVFVSSFEPAGPTETSPDFAILLAVDDAEAARGFLDQVADQDPAAEEERSYEGTDYLSTSAGITAGVVDDTALVLGTEDAFQVAVDSAEGESLGESSEYTERTAALPDDALASIFFEPAATIEAVLAAEGADPAQARMWAPLLDGLLSEPLAATLTATPDAASVDVAAMLDSNVLLGADPSLVTSLPGDSWFAIAIPQLGHALAHGLDQLSSSGLPGAGELERQVRERTGLELGEVFGWLGDAAAFVAGTERPEIRAGLIAETSDPQASMDVLAALERLPGVEADVVGDSLVAARGTTVDEAVEPAESLGDAPGFRAATDALGDDFPPGLYLDLPALFSVAEQGSDGDIDYDAIRPYTSAFGSLIAGTRVDGDLVLSRITVLLAGK
jgi:hypothetical protein